MLFAEATSALNSLTKEKITDTIKDISPDGTQIAILNYAPLICNYACRLDICAGKRRCIGNCSHEKLPDEKGLYYAVWRQQIDKRKMKVITGPRC